MAIDSLNDYQLRQGMRRLILSGKPHAPALPEFMKLCRTVGNTDELVERPPPHPALTHQVEWDRWLLAGNRRLMRYITTKIPENPQRYGRGCSAAALMDRNRDHDKVLDASPQFVSAINTLVAMKNRWVEIMQQSAGPDGVPPDDQNQCWANCMREAEEVIARERAA